MKIRRRDQIAALGMGVVLAILCPVKVWAFDPWSNVNGYWISADGSNGFVAAPTSLTIGGTAKTAGTDYTFEKSGWIKLTAKPAAGDEILLVVNGTTYKATVPAATP